MARLFTVPCSLLQLKPHDSTYSVINTQLADAHARAARHQSACCTCLKLLERSASWRSRTLSTRRMVPVSDLCGFSRFTAHYNLNSCRCCNELSDQLKRKMSGRQRSYVLPILRLSLLLDTKAHLIRDHFTVQKCTANSLQLHGVQNSSEAFKNMIRTIWAQNSTGFVNK